MTMTATKPPPAATMHTLVDPTTRPIIPTFVSAPRLDTLENKRVGLIDDAKDGAREPAARDYRRSERALWRG